MFAYSYNKKTQFMIVKIQPSKMESGQLPVRCSLVHYSSLNPLRLGQIADQLHLQEISSKRFHSIKQSSGSKVNT